MRHALADRDRAGGPGRVTQQVVALATAHQHVVATATAHQKVVALATAPQHVATAAARPRAPGAQPDGAAASSGAAP